MEFFGLYEDNRVIGLSTDPIIQYGLVAPF